MVVGLGVALYLGGLWTTSLGSHGVTGWTGYAPLSTNDVPLFGGFHSWVRLVIWLVFILVWVVASIALFREPRQGDIDG